MVFKVKQKELSPRKLAFFIKDEKKASKEYHKFGLHNLAKDEEKHLKFLKSLKVKKKVKKNMTM